MVKPLIRLFLVLVVAGASISAQAPQPRGNQAASAVGISAQRLTRLHDGMKAFVDRKDVAGVVTLVMRDGRTVDVHATGYRDIETKSPMRADTIFRIASMTKPITSVAVMMLYEEGLLFLTDPVSRYIPAFKSMTVIEQGADKPVPARRAITIRDLLSHRSGLTYGFLNGGAVGNSYRKNGVTDGLTTTTLTLAENVDKLAAQPLIAQPGAAWNYSLSTDVLGRVVEVVSGQPFEVFMRDRIIKPLKMVDTDFVIPESKWPRVATVYSPDGAGGLRPMRDPESFGNATFSPIEYYKSRTYFSGGAGLVSTAADYARFAQMLLNGGSIDGVQLLSPKSIELMTRSHTTDLPAGGLLGAGTGFGLGFRVVTDIAQTGAIGSDGRYGWLGIYGTEFWIDPKERLIGIVLVQRYPGSPVATAFQPLVYQALVK